MSDGYRDIAVERGEWGPQPTYECKSEATLREAIRLLKTKTCDFPPQARADCAARHPNYEGGDWACSKAAKYICRFLAGLEES